MHLFSCGNVAYVLVKEDRQKCVSQAQADLGDVVGLVPDHLNKADMAIKQVTRIFWFPSAYKSYVYTKMQSV